MDASMFGKLFGEFKVVLKNLKVGYNKEDNSINYIDNSTTNNNVYNCPLSPKCGQLTEDKLEKIKEETMATVENAYKENPEKIISLIATMNQLALSVAANTVTAQSLAPWLSGATTVEPLTPMPSGDFIEKWSKTVNQIISGDTIGITEKVDVKIKDENL